MAANPNNNIHNDAYMTDAYQRMGPLGRKPVTTSTLQAAECASLTFDRRNRLETVCVGTNTVMLKLFDPTTLEELASYNLPPRRPATGTFNDFSGGGYFYLDHRDRAVIPTTDNHVYVVAQTAGPGFELRRDYDLTPAIGSEDKIVSVLPDWSGAHARPGRAQHELHRHRRDRRCLCRHHQGALPDRRVRGGPTEIDLAAGLSQLRCPETGADVCGFGYDPHAGRS
jgi:hypothetical protein